MRAPHAPTRLPALEVGNTDLVLSVDLTLHRLRGTDLDHETDLRDEDHEL